MVKKKKNVKAKKMVKKAIKKVKKPKKARSIKKTKKVQKTKKVLKLKREKVLGKIDHFFDKISVAAIKVTAPFKVGDIIHVKGHTTDFNQRIESMQIEHQDVQKVKKGDDVGLKTRDFVRDHDVVYFAANQKEVEEKSVIQAKTSAPANPKPMFQTSIFQTEKPISPPAIKPGQLPSALPSRPASKPIPKKETKEDPYSKTKFFNF